MSKQINKKIAIISLAWFSLVFLVTGGVDELIFTVHKVFLILITLFSEICVSCEIMCNNFIIILRAVNWSGRFLLAYLSCIYL